jgi:hypothetical protein
LFINQADKQNDESVHSIGWRGMIMKPEKNIAERLEVMKKGIRQISSAESGAPFATESAAMVAAVCLDEPAAAPEIAADDSDRGDAWAGLATIPTAPPTSVPAAVLKAVPTADVRQGSEQVARQCCRRVRRIV